ncbi:MAG: hypothetical protein AAGA01_11020, partial [Cyanobacteria bacterium P01_E01_bin.43]
FDVASAGVLTYVFRIRAVEHVNKKASQIDALAELVAQLHHNFDVVGCSLLEFLPSGSHALATSDALRLLKQVNLPLLTGL